MLTSTLNSVLYLGHANVAYMYGGASDVDTNADAMLTISSTAINAFLHQIALAPIFGMITAQQTVMCEVNGILAVFDSQYFTLTLKSAALAGASDIIAGQCLTIGDQAIVNNPDISLSSVAYTLGTVAGNLLQTSIVRTVEPIIHTIDGVIAYSIGVLQATGALIESQVRLLLLDIHEKSQNTTNSVLTTTKSIAMTIQTHGSNNRVLTRRTSMSLNTDFLLMVKNIVANPA